MTEAFLGGLASSRLCRYDGNQGRIALPQFRNPWGYGLYFTDNRLIGVSYKKIVSAAYRPGFLLFLIWIVSLVSLIAYFVTTKVTESIFVPFDVGFAFVPLVFLVYWGPKQARIRTERQVVNSVWELEVLQKDLVLQKSDISQVSIQGRKFYDPWGGGFVSGSAVSVSLRTGQIIMFVNALRGESLRRLVALPQSFCAQEPSIVFSVK